WPQVARTLCSRHTGIGADGMLVLEASRRADVRMRIFNVDGSEAQMCGNGARCVALYHVQQQATSDKQHGSTRRSVTIETKVGMLSAMVRGERVAMRMTDPTGLELGRRVAAGGCRFRLSVVNTGVPHAVVPVAAVDRVDVQRLGRTLRRHPAFAPRGTNVNFIQAAGRRLRVRTYERGVEEETLACGTGIAASAIIHGLSRTNGSNGRIRVEVEPRSGDRLSVSFAVRHRRGEQRVTDVVLTGPAQRVFDGAVEWPTRRG
ncbi:MAG: diaminopimelate epimerase, partial [Candidatus Omnitrophica bacterium]|nr:diaminopimelate epimerase [Candidatus Omnitrophota bacterium]